MRSLVKPPRRFDLAQGGGPIRREWMKSDAWYPDMKCRPKRVWSDRFWQLRSFLALQYFGRFRSEADKYQRRP